MSAPVRTLDQEIERLCVNAGLDLEERASLFARGLGRTQAAAELTGIPARTIRLNYTETIYAARADALVEAAKGDTR